jgi:hypothetical protein
MRFLDRSRNLAKFFMIMCFVVKLVYPKVVDNLCIKMLLTFGGIWPCGLGVIAVESSVTELLALCLVRSVSVFV